MLWWTTQDRSSFCFHGNERHTTRWNKRSHGRVNSTSLLRSLLQLQKMRRYICDCLFCEGHWSAVCQTYFPFLFSSQLDHVPRLPCSHMLEFWPVECELKWSSPRLGGHIKKNSWSILYDVSLFPSAGWWWRSGGPGEVKGERQRAWLLNHPL